MFLCLNGKSFDPLRNVYCKRDSYAFFSIESLILVLYAAYVYYTAAIGSFWFLSGITLHIKAAMVYLSLFIHW
jgi:ABC-type antimicrobial peptide transport system permease subunit